MILQNMTWNSDFSTWLSRDTKTNQFVILKIFSARPDLDKLVMLEIELLQQIQIKIMESRDLNGEYADTQDDDEETYFVKLYNAFRFRTRFDKERLRWVLVYETYGFDCNQLYESKKIVLKNTKDLINQIIFTINLLHDRCNIAHGDLSPSNIVFCATRNQMQNIYSKIFTDIKQKAENRLRDFYLKLKRIREDGSGEISRGSGHGVFDREAKKAKPLGIEGGMGYKYDPKNLEREEEISQSESSKDSENLVDITVEDRKKLILNKEDLFREFRKKVKKDKKKTNKEKANLKKKLKNQMKKDIVKFEKLKIEARKKKEESERQRKLERKSRTADEGCDSSPNMDRIEDSFDDDPQLHQLKKYNRRNASSMKEEIKEKAFFKEFLVDFILSQDCVQIKLINFYNGFFLEEGKDPRTFKINRHSAPEILRCYPVNHKIDLWSLGSSIFELLTHKNLGNFLNSEELRKRPFEEKLRSCYHRFQKVTNCLSSEYKKLEQAYFGEGGDLHIYNGIDSISAPYNQRPRDDVHLPLRNHPRQRVSGHARDLQPDRLPHANALVRSSATRRRGPSSQPRLADQ